MELPAKPFHLLTPEERVPILEDFYRDLVGAYKELSQVKIQYLWAYGQAYRASQSSHVSGRIQEAEIAASAIKEDELELTGRIEGLNAMIDLLTRLS